MLRKYAERGDEGLLPAAEEIAQHGYLADYLYGLIGSDQLAPSGPLVGYMHPNGFSKIRLVSLTDNGWAARLHIWNAGSSDPDIHSHRWPFASYVLSGSLVEKSYAPNSGAGEWTRHECSPSIDGLYKLDNPRACNVALIAEDTYHSGRSYQRSAEALHLAMTRGQADPTVALFIQGSERRKSSTVIKSRQAAIKPPDPIPQYGIEELAHLLRIALSLIANG